MSMYVYCVYVCVFNSYCEILTIQMTLKKDITSSSDIRHNSSIISSMSRVLLDLHLNFKFNHFTVIQ